MEEVANTCCCCLLQHKLLSGLMASHQSLQPWVSSSHDGDQVLISIFILSLVSQLLHQSSKYLFFYI